MDPYEKIGWKAITCFTKKKKKKSMFIFITIIINSKSGQWLYKKTNRVSHLIMKYVQTLQEIVIVKMKLVKHKVLLLSKKNFYS